MCVCVCASECVCVSVSVNECVGVTTRRGGEVKARGQQSSYIISHERILTPTRINIMYMYIDKCMFPNFCAKEVKTEVTFLKQ